jgi:hypothetical protein
MYPKLMTQRGKHGDRRILITDAQDEKQAWLVMFLALDKYDDCYYELDDDQLDWYDQAKHGNDCVAAKWLLDSRSDNEYEEVFIDCIETVESLGAKVNA